MCVFPRTPCLCFRILFLLRTTPLSCSRSLRPDLPVHLKANAPPLEARNFFRALLWFDPYRISRFAGSGHFPVILVSLLHPHSTQFTLGIPLHGVPSLFQRVFLSHSNLCTFFSRSLMRHPGLLVVFFSPFSGVLRNPKPTESDLDASPQQFSHWAKSPISCFWSFFWSFLIVDYRFSGLALLFRYCGFSLSHFHLSFCWFLVCLIPPTPVRVPQMAFVFVLFCM